MMSCDGARTAEKASPAPVVSTCEIANLRCIRLHEIASLRMRVKQHTYTTGWPRAVLHEARSILVTGKWRSPQAAGEGKSPSLCLPGCLLQDRKGLRHAIHVTRHVACRVERIRNRSFGCGAQRRGLDGAVNRATPIPTPSQTYSSTPRVPQTHAPRASRMHRTPIAPFREQRWRLFRPA